MRTRKNRAIVTGCLVLVAVVFTVILAGCGPPPPDAEVVNMLDFSYETMLELNKYSGDIKGFRNFFLQNRDAKRVFAFLEDSLVIVKSGAGQNLPGTILRSLEGNKLILEQGLYVTEGRKNEALVSLDGKTWYSTRNDFDKGIDNFQNFYRYDLDYEKEKNVLQINYTLSSRLNPEATEIEVGGRRKSEIIEKGMVFKHPVRREVNYDLQKRIVYIPAGTVVDAEFLFTGNLMLCGKTSGDLIFLVLRDIFLYKIGMRFGISFDGSNWGVNLLSFSIKPMMYVYAERDDYIKVIFGMEASYNN